MDSVFFIVGYAMTGFAMAVAIVRIYRHSFSQRLNVDPYSTRVVRPRAVQLPDGTVYFVRASTQANAERIVLRDAHRYEAGRQPRVALPDPSLTDRARRLTEALSGAEDR